MTNGPYLLAEFQTNNAVVLIFIRKWKSIMWWLVIITLVMSMSLWHMEIQKRNGWALLYIIDLDYPCSIEHLFGVYICNMIHCYSHASRYCFPHLKKYIMKYKNTINRQSSKNIYLWLMYCIYSLALNNIPCQNSFYLSFHKIRMIDYGISAVPFTAVKCIWESHGHVMKYDILSVNKIIIID